MLFQTAITTTTVTFLFLNLSGAVTISEERKVCTGSEKFFKMCDSNEVRGHVELEVAGVQQQTVT